MTTGDEADDEAPCPPPPEFAGATVREMRIVNRKGLHARATAKFVQCVERFDAQIRVTRCGETVGGDSIMGILTLGCGAWLVDHRRCNRRSKLIRRSTPSPL